MIRLNNKIGWQLITCGLIYALCLEGIAFSKDTPTQQVQGEIATVSAASLPSDSQHQISSIAHDNAQDVVGRLSAQSIDTLSLTECLKYLHQLVPEDSDREEITVTWTGLLKPPYSGSYKFSTTPINVNQSGRRGVEHRLIVSLGDKVVLDSYPEQQEPKSDSTVRDRRSLAAQKRSWVWEGKPTELVGGSPKPIKFEVTYSNKARSPFGSPSAILYWEGPSLERQIVDGHFLSTDNDKQGLRAEYRWQSQSGERVIVQQNENIDFAWSSESSLGSKDHAWTKRLSDRVFELVTSATYLSEVASGHREHVYFTDELSTSYLSSRQRSDFLKQLNSRRELLERISDDEIVSVYRRLRYGAEDDSLKMLGEWLQLRSNIGPQFANQFFKKNRKTYWDLAELLTHQDPDRVQSFGKDYLEFNDGHCCLPIAYLHTYVNLLEGTSSLWIDFLKEALSQSSLDGDVRVNWLIARAQAEETGNGGGRGRSIAPLLGYPKPRLSLGLGWLDEARLVAESNEKQIQIHIEIAARMAALGDQKRAQETLELAEAYADSVAHKKQLSEALAAIDQQFVENRQQTHRRTAARNLAKRKMLEERLAQAQKRNDITAQNRYQALLEHLP